MTQFEVAQILAASDGITREEMDAFAAESHRRAHESWESGHFAAEMVPVPDQDAEGVETDAILDRDEGIRPETDRRDAGRARTGGQVGPRSGAGHHRRATPRRCPTARRPC